MQSGDDQDRAGSGSGDHGAPNAANHDRRGLEEEGESPYDELVAQLLSMGGGGALNVPELAEAVERQEAPDAADTLESLDEEKAAEVLAEMEAQSAAEAVAEMERPLAVSVVDDLIDEGRFALAGQLLGLMAPDDAADLLQAIDERHRENLLRGMPFAQAVGLRKLIEYDAESAGGIMTTDFILLRDAMTVAEATDVVRKHPIHEAVQYLPVIDSQSRLVGLASLRDLLLHKPHERVRDFMDREVDTLSPAMDREAVAHEFDRYDYVMMPVVDDQNRVLGIVTVDDVIDIIRREQTEDVQKLVGAGAEEAVYSKVGEKIRGRFPWLLVNLFTSTIAAIVVLQFDDLIEELAILAVLMPVIANQAGNAGQQSLAVTLRGIVLDQVRSGRVMPLLAREALVGAFNGVVGGLLVGGGLALFSAFVRGASWQLGLVAAIAMACSLSLGCFVGSSMPIVMRRFGFDPATGSTIFLTMTTDSMSFLLFLGLARLLSSMLLN